MKSMLLSTLALSFALVGGAAAADDLTATERAALAAQTPAVELVSMRAGASEPVTLVATAERAELARAAASATDLDALRAGDIDDHDLAVIGVVVGIVVLAILIF